MAEEPYIITERGDPRDRIANQRDPIKQALKEDYEMRRWDSTREDLERAERELRTMERAPGEGRVADEQAWLDACANKRAWIAKLKDELGATDEQIDRSFDAYR